MSREFYRQLAGLAGDTENLVVTVLDGPHAGAKAVLQNGKVVFAEGMFWREYERCLRRCLRARRDWLFAVRGMSGSL